MHALLQRLRRLRERITWRPQCKVCFHVGCAITDADLDGYTDRAEFLRSRLRDHHAVTHAGGDKASRQSIHEPYRA